METPEILSYDDQVQATLTGLASEREDFWLDLKSRVERTGGRDCQLNAEFAESNRRMDCLLDQYAGLLMLSVHMADVKVLA